MATDGSRGLLTAILAVLIVIAALLASGEPWLSPAERDAKALRDRLDRRAGSTGGVGIDALRSELRDLVTAQEAFYLEHDRYATDLRLLAGYQAPPDVTVEILAASEDGWSARAMSDSSGTACEIEVGTSTPVEGQVRCD